MFAKHVPVLKPLCTKAFPKVEVYVWAEASLENTYSLPREFLFPAQAAKAAWYALFSYPFSLIWKYLTLS